MAELMKLWASVEKTDPKYLKDGQKGLSSIDSYYVFKQATQSFGPCGIGWGYEIIEEDYRSGAPIFSKDKSEILGHEIDHMIHLKLWYKWEGEKGELSQYGVTRYVYGSKYGPITDEEAPKKSITDAIKKCLSMLGVCADVYMGQFEDDAYRAAAEKRAELERSARSQEEFDKAVKEMDDWLNHEVKAASELNRDSSFKAAMNAIRRKLITKCELIGITSEKRVAHIDNLIESRKSQQEETRNAS